MKFYEKAQQKENTKPLASDAAYLFAISAMLDQLSTPREVAESEYPQFGFVPAVIGKRLSVLGLDGIAFAESGIAGLNAIADGNPGRAIVVLIDLLTKYSEPGKKKLITSVDLADIYPFGHYSDEVLRDYIDNYIKPRKVKWSEIY